MSKFTTPAILEMLGHYNWRVQRTKREADKIFLDGMTVLGVPKWKRTIMYYAVRFFGNGNYKHDKSEKG